MSPRDDERLPAWRRYLRFWRSDAPADVSDELAFHLESTVDEFVAAGMSRNDARDAARKKFGDVNRITATLNTLSEQRERHMERAERFQNFRQDVVFALRQLRKSPGFTIVAVLTLALGIGATSAIFSVVDSVLLQPLPYAHANRVLSLCQRNGSDPVCWLPFGNYNSWKQRATGFEAIGATWGPSSLTLTGQGDPTPVQATQASASYWKAMWIPPVIGRYFTEAEDRDGASRVAVLSTALWRNRFGGDRNVVGRTITLNGRPYTVVGVAPPDYILTPPTEMVWVPLAPPASRLADFGDHELLIYGLVKPGVAPAAAVRQLAQIEAGLAKENPHAGYDGGVIASPLIDAVTGDHRLVLYLLLGAVALVLLIACGNIANLLLARANVRRGEIAIRGALGATTRRLVMQLLTESLLLAVGGAVVGLGLALAAVRFLVRSPVPLPRLQHAALNGPVLAFTLLLAVACSVIFGLVPALRATRIDLQLTLRDGGRESRGGARHALRRALVVGELCMAQVLLVGAGLLIHSSIRVQSVSAGFDTHNLLAFSLSLPGARYPDEARVEATFQQIDASIAAIPGVAAEGRTLVAPIYGNGWSWGAFREGSDGHDAGSVGANMRMASAGYFSALGVRLLRGRDFRTADGVDAPSVAIVSRGLAKRLYGRADPIGRRISNGNVENPKWKEIVGVVDDMHANGLTDDPPLELYMPSTQWSNPQQTLVIRGSVDVTTLVPAIRRAVASVDPLLALVRVATMQQAIDDQRALPRFTTWLLSLLGATGLILAAIGVYGVVAYSVSQRSHEFGVRMALGATAGTVQGMVLRQGVALAAAGVGVGLVVALAAGRILRGLTFGVTSYDPVTFIAVAVVLVVVTLLASVIPARRATRIDPLEALRGS